MARYQQKRLAISQEYSDKINKAQSEGERLSLQASMDDALSKLDFEQIKGNMNWEDVFGNLRRYDNQPTRKNTSAAKEHAFRRKSRT